MMPLIFAVLLLTAIALLAFAFWLDNAAFGVASASVFLIIGGVLLTEGVEGLPGFATTAFATLSVVLAIGVVLQMAIGDSN